MNLGRETPLRHVVRVFIVCAAMALFVGAGVEVYQIGWGTGVWIGQFAPSWFVVFLFFLLFSVASILVVACLLWQPHTLDRTFRFLANLRNQMGFVRWFVAAVFLLFPSFIFQYTFWGVVLHGPFLRTLLAVMVSLFVGWLLTQKTDRFVDWTSLSVSVLLTAGVLSLVAPFARVTSYPFSLGWSEGNRLWDYSILFRREIYNYPVDQRIPVFLDTSRQFVGGIPFLIPGVTIDQVRLWLSLVDIVPYLILGWVVFRRTKTNYPAWVLAGIWAFTFVRQGPIHAPLLICAIVVALAWNRPIWLAALMIFAAGYAAQASRFTWLFAPAMWSVMLEFASAYELNKNVWRRAIAVGIAGVLGGYIAPFFVPSFIHWVKNLDQTTGAGITFSSVQNSLSSQPLIWSRLFPNSTYGPGILLGLTLAAAPLIVILLYLVKTKFWKLSEWQKVSLILPLLAFLAVGLIVSVKIGGGGDLHNLDMFIIGLLFAAAIIWRNGGDDWIRDVDSIPAWVAAIVILLFALPALRPLTEMRPIFITKDPKLVATLADITPMDPLPNPLPDTLPSDADTQKALKKVQTAVGSYASSGEVLFMDQRQLLTFGYIKDVSLVPEYDKKLLIDMAMADNAVYFDGFYQDLASHRFALIVTSPLNRRLDQEEGNFGEENNAWVKWVSNPLLCYYQPLDTLKKVDVELLVPRMDVADCTSVLPK